MSGAWVTGRLWLGGRLPWRLAVEQLAWGPVWRPCSVGAHR